MNIDWGVVATLMVVLKGLWDIYKERHKPEIDLASIDSNIAQAASVSVKTLLDAIAQLQTRTDGLEKSDRRMRNEIQSMGQALVSLRQSNTSLRNLVVQILGAYQHFIDRVNQITSPVSTAEEQAVLDRAREELARLSATEPK